MEKWLRNTTVVRIAAVMLAILLWVVVHLDEQVSPVPTSPQMQTRSISDVQITTMGLNDESYNIKSIEPSYVNIVLKGRESPVNQANPKDRIQLDLSEISEPGEHILPLSAVDFPAGVQVDIYPPHVTVYIEEIQNKEVPIEIKMIGQPAEGYKAGTPILKPIRAIVTVPSSRVDEIVAVQAEVDISNAQETVQESATLIAINAEGQEVEASISPAVVNVDIPITSPLKTIPLQINLINDPAKGFSVASFKQSINEVIVYGPESILEGIDIYNNIEIDLSGLTSTRNQKLPLPLKDGWIEIYPEFVEVEVVIVPSARETFEQIPIIISGKNELYNTRVMEPESGAINVVIVGAPSVLNTLRSTDIQAIVDVSNLPPGTYEQTVKFNLPSYVKYGGSEEFIVTVVIEAESEEAETETEPDPEAGAGAEEVINDVPPDESEASRNNS